MYIEIRNKTESGVTSIRGLVLVTESEEERLLLDEVFGDRVKDPDGLISKRTVECRLSDGHGEHYLYIPKEAKE